VKLAKGGQAAVSEDFQRQRPLKNAQFCSKSRKARILNIGIPGVFRGLEFESDAEIGQKGAFFKGLGKSLVLRGGFGI
jgi:hypothetical protein